MKKSWANHRFSGHVLLNLQEGNLGNPGTGALVFAHGHALLQAA